MRELGIELAAELCQTLLDEGVCTHTWLAQASYKFDGTIDFYDSNRWNLAQIADESEGRLTRTRQFVGTLRYASSEQVLSVKLDLAPHPDVQAWRQTGKAIAWTARCLADRDRLQGLADNLIFEGFKA